MERIEDLLLERASPRGPAKPLPLFFVHGMWMGSWCWEQPFQEIPGWTDKALGKTGT